MEFQHAHYPIAQLLDWTRAGKLALPDFQRDFVWSPRKVVDLLHSVSRGWPIGSLLILAGPQEFLARSIDSAPALGAAAERFVLDGQQRITALYHALTDSSDIVYYVDLRALLDEKPDYIKWEQRAAFSRAHPDVRSRTAAGIVLLREMATEELFFEWCWAAPKEFADVALPLREKHFGGLTSRVYAVPAVELPQYTEPDDLARIFETTNRTGTRLDAFDLLVAVLFPFDFNLRLKWESARDAYPILIEFEVAGIEVVKLIALWERQQQRAGMDRPSIKGVGQGDLLNVPPRVVRDSWGFTLHWYIKALQFMREKLGVVGPQNLPAIPMVLTLANLLRTATDAGEGTEPIERWYWKSIASQRYARGADAKVIEEVERLDTPDQALRDDARGGSLEDMIPALLEPQRRNRILLRGISNALAVADAVDPFSMKFLKDSKIVQGIPVRCLRAGTYHPDDKSPIADLVFMDPQSAQEVALQVSKGKALESILDGEFLAQQGFNEADPFSGNYVYARAALLAGLLVDLAAR